MIDPKKNIELDLTRIMIRPLYFGLIVNIAIPAILLFICYTMRDATLENKLGEAANAAFYIFCVIAASLGALALWWRSRLLRQPAIKAKDTMEDDLRDALALRLRPVLVLVSTISLVGFSYFFLTGRFEEALFFVIVSFVLFQVIRPRYGSVQTWVDYQQELADQGQFHTFKERQP